MSSKQSRRVFNLDWGLLKKFLEDKSRKVGREWVGGDVPAEGAVLTNS